MTKPRIGLLALYIKLYDDSSPEVRPGMDQFYQLIAQEFKDRNVDVETYDVCRIESEFKKAVEKFEQMEVDMLVTLHLAYSPSLESSKILAGTWLPLLILDTTPDFEFGPMQDQGKIMYNHGIHGVQDMCNLLIRNGKPFHIEVGHWKNSDVIDRVTRWIKGAKMARTMGNLRVGTIGGPFKGMGDFQVPVESMEALIGIKTVNCDNKKMSLYLKCINDAEVESEAKYDLEHYNAEALDKEAREIHKKAVHTGLAIRKWIAEEKLDAFTFNFLDIDKSTGLSAVPFLEASKALSRGYGYAGEGDVLTAALVATLASVYPETTFVEMFCPDWKDNTVFLSHMGEINLKLVDGDPELKITGFPYTDMGNQIAAFGRYKAGDAVLINLAPGSNSRFTLLVSKIEMLDIEKDNFDGNVRGWFRPSGKLPEFLSKYSCKGGTHHSAMVYGDFKEEIICFGKLMDWNVVEL